MMTTFVQQAVDLSKRAGFSLNFHPRPLPSLREEAWRLSQLKRLQEVELKELAEPLALELFKLDEKGRPHRLQSLPAGLTVTEEESFSPTENQQAGDEFYEDIPRLFPRRGVVVKVSAQYEGPALLFRWTVRASKEGTVLAPLDISWELEPGASLRAARFLEVPAEALAIVRETLHIGAGAQMELASHTHRQEGISLESRTAKVDRDGSFTHFVLDVGESYSRQSLTCKLQEEGARCRVLGAVGLTAQEASEHPIVIDHKRSHTQSDQLFKSVLSGRGRAVMNGKVVIRQDAQKVDSSQYNKNLLLSRTAFVHSKPELRVAADDVKAAHGATSGQIRPEEIFYLKSRGISEERALELISAGFLREVVEQLSHPALRLWALQCLDEKLPRILAEGVHGLT